MRLRPSSLLLLAALAGCAADEELSADSFMDEDHPPYGCDSEPTGPGCESSSDGGTAKACNGSFDCEVGELCAADFNGEIGGFSCQSLCIEAMDDLRWCSDDDACCDALAVCTRGYCIPGTGTSSTTSVDTSSTDTSSSGVDSSGGDPSSSSGDVTTSGGSSSG